MSAAARTFHLHQGISSSRTFVLHNGVDLHQFCPRPPTGWLHKELALPRDATLIGGVGQIGPRKGWDVLIEAMKRTLPGGQSHLLIVGERNSSKQESIEYEQSLKRSTSMVPLAGRVHFLGRRDDVHAILPELTCLIHPARQEPLGRVLLESAASGLPIIATAVGGTAEILFDHDSALLVPSGDAKAIACRLHEILESKTLRETLGGNARRRALATFDVNIAAQALVQHYRDLVDVAI